MLLLSTKLLPQQHRFIDLYGVSKRLGNTVPFPKLSAWGNRLLYWIYQISHRYRTSYSFQEEPHQEIQNCHLQNKACLLMLLPPAALGNLWSQSLLPTALLLLSTIFYEQNRLAAIGNMTLMKSWTYIHVFLQTKNHNLLPFCQWNQPRT